MSKLNLLVAACVTVAGCAVNNTQTSEPAKPPTGAPREAKGQLPMGSTMKPKAVTAVKEMGGKPMVSGRSEVTVSGSFSLTLEVGVRYMFIITLEDGSMISLYASDANTDYYNWLPIGNSLDGSLALDFGTLVIVDNVFVSNTVLVYMDWDDDGVADFDDDDDDNDGIDDFDDFDTDGDGIEDDYLDGDGDGECDLVDADDDGDGIDDVDDTDDDGDGIDDAAEGDDDDIDIDGDGDPDDGDGEPDDDGGDPDDGGGDPDDGGL